MDGIILLGDMVIPIMEVLSILPLDGIHSIITALITVITAPIIMGMATHLITMAITIITMDIIAHTMLGLPTTEATATATGVLTTVRKLEIPAETEPLTTDLRAGTGLMPAMDEADLLTTVRMPEAGTGVR